MIKNLFKMMLIPVLMTLFAGMSAFAQSDYKGEITLSYLNFDDEGNRSAARELFDTYDGFNFQNLTIFGNFNPHTRYFLRLDDINLDGRRVNLKITDINLFRFKADYRQTRLLFGPEEDLKNERKAYSGYLEVRPAEMFTGYVEYRGHQNEGDRIVHDIADQGLFGRLYDRKSSFIKGGAKIRHQANHLDVSYGYKKYDDSINDSLDSKTNSILISGYGKIHPKIKIVAKFNNVSKEKELSGDKLNENLFRLTVLSKPTSELTLAPEFSYRAVSGERVDPDFNVVRFGLFAEYFLPPKTTISGTGGYETRSSGGYNSSLLYYKLSARSRLHEKLHAKLSYSGESRKDPDEVLVTGVEDKTTIKAEMDIIPCKHADVKAGYKQLQRENSDINTKAEIGSFYATLEARRGAKGRFAFQFNRSDVEYTWGDEVLKYKYNSISGTVECHPKDKLTLSAGGVFYIYDDDVQQDKLDVTVGAAYQLPKARLGVSYRRYELDGYKLMPTYYEANMIKGEITFNLAP